MLQIHHFVLGAYQTNCFVIRDSHTDHCCVIDPGYQPERIAAYLQQETLSLDAILLTHGHFDHVGGVRELAAKTGCRVYIHPGDLALPGAFTAGEIYHTHTYEEGTVLDLAGLSIQIIHTPGHTPGSVCLITEAYMFSGDTLFEGSCGRTDLPGGSQAAIRRSLRRLAEMEADLTVFPGHGASTTLAEEKKYNPYMR